jgi:hypothetical protein
MKITKADEALILDMLLRLRNINDEISDEIHRCQTSREISESLKGHLLSVESTDPEFVKIMEMLCLKK